MAELWPKGWSAKIDAKLHKRILVRLYRLNVATAPEQMNLPGFDFHAPKGFVPTRYTIHVNGPWCITFEFGIRRFPPCRPRTIPLRSRSHG